MFAIRLAGHVIAVDNRYPYLERLCADYRADAEPEFCVRVTPAEIRREAEDGDWPEAYLESLAVYRKICERLLEDGILLFHCSALAVDGRAYLFTAPSGTGKSTHARLWRERFGARVTVVNDDKPLLKVRPDGVTVYGTPYGGKDNLQTNTSAPVAGIVILHQAKENAIRRMRGMEAYPTLLNQTYRRGDEAGMRRTLALVQRLSELPVYSLGCTVSAEAAELAYRALTGGGN